MTVDTIVKTSSTIGMRTMDVVAMFLILASLNVLTLSPHMGHEALQGTEAGTFLGTVTRGLFVVIIAHCVFSLVVSVRHLVRHVRG